ncbi:GntR family transcriptional regulator, partial [Klebsiella pneumoniae]|uniref:GntR family transcriptional regulator n=1 Tax=Klebsiella pneumoniae TaxID=573 RepID=UPI001932DDA2
LDRGAVRVQLGDFCRNQAAGAIATVGVYRSTQGWVQCRHTRRDGNSQIDKPSYTYQAVYRYLLDRIEAAPCDVEQRLPSLRELARRLGVSVS